MYMAKSRREKNKDLYDQLENEMKNNKENSYEEKLKNLDPNLNASGDVVLPKEEVVVNKKNEAKNTSSLTVIAKKVNGEKINKKNEIVKVEKKHKKEEEIIDVEDLNEPVSFTDKLSVEEILRAKLVYSQCPKITSSLWATIAITVATVVAKSVLCHAIMCWGMYGLFGIRIITMRRCWHHGHGVKKLDGTDLEWG